MTTDNLYVIKRFVLKTLLLGSFALLHGRDGALRTASIFFMLAAILDAGLAYLRNEQLLLQTLSHWDESIAFATLSVAFITISATFS